MINNTDSKCKCGCASFFTEVHGNHTGLYCCACGKWQKWLTKDELRAFEHKERQITSTPLIDKIMAHVNRSAIKVSTVKAPHTYMKAVGTNEIERILREELGNGS